MTALVKPENDTRRGLEFTTFYLEGIYCQKTPKNSTAFYAAKESLKQGWCVSL